MEKLKELCNNPWSVFKFFAHRRMLIWLPDQVYLRIMYRASFGKKLNLKEPKSFNEKLQWLKLNNRNPLYTNMVDKYLVREFVSNVIGSDYLIPLLGVWDTPDEIDFFNLPNQFVLKCNHDSGGIIICKDKSRLDIEKTKEILKKSMSHNYFWGSREWPYKNVKARIIAEKYMVDFSNQDLKDYKIFCFNGIPKITLVCSERFSDKGLREDFFDNEWNHLFMRRPKHLNAEFEIEKPLQFEEMRGLAEKLAKGIPFVRIDFYIVNGHIYFGEMTFFPASGFASFTPEKWDDKLGEWISLS